MTTIRAFTAVALLGAAFAASSADAGGLRGALVDGNGLRGSCARASSNPMEGGFCLGYIGGIAGAMAAGDTAGGFAACISPRAWQGCRRSRS